jgi:hypothetical protein
MGAPFNLRIIDAAAPAEIVSTPSYTDIFNEVMGTAATDQDGFAEDLASLATLVSAFEGEVTAPDVTAGLASATANLDSADPAALDATVANYVGTIPAGKQFVSDGEALAPPKILELPISAGPLGGSMVPPAQTKHDFGTVKLGSKPVTVSLGTQTIIGNQTNGLFDVSLIDPGDGAFSVDSDEKDTASGNQRITFTLTMTPSVLGQHVGQLNTFPVRGGQMTITTLTVNVVP